jgi:hypothetical protein
MPPEPPQEIPPRVSVWLGRVAAVLGAILIALYYFTPAQEVMNATLDSSNYASYAYFTAKGFQYGQQVVPMVGPLGFVMYGFIYGGNLFWDRLYLDLVIKLGLAALLLWFFCRSRRGIIRWLWLAVLLGVTPLIHDSAYDFAILFGGLFLLVNPYQTRRQQTADLAVAAFLALLAMLKGTQLTLSLLALGFVAGAARDFRRFAWLAGAFVASFLLIWAFAGQSLANIPGFLLGIKELSIGYNDTMSLQESPGTTVTGVAVLSLLLLAIMGSWLVRRDRRPVGFALLLLGGFTFIIWKHGFVRADGHVLIFFHDACAIAMTALLLLNFEARERSAWTRREVYGRRAVHGVAALAVLGGLYGSGQRSIVQLKWELSQLPGLIPAHVEHLLTVRTKKTLLDQERGLQRLRFALPRVAEMVGPGSIDFFGFGHGFLPLNRLNYQPRPMGGGSFNVFTPYLQKLNEQYLLNPHTRPGYMLLNLETIDDRFLAQDDARSLVALIEGYEPVEAEQGMLLLRARPGVAPAEPRLLGERAFVFGENVPVPAAQPGEIVLASFELPLNLAGRARSFFYKPPVLHLHLDGNGIHQPDNRRINASMVRLPMVLSPVLEETPDLLALYSEDPGKTVHGIRIEAVSPGFHASDRLRVRFSAVLRPPTLSATGLEKLAGRLRYPVADTTPLLIERATSPLRSFDGYLVQMLEPPGKIVFPLQGDEREVYFDYGLDPEAYEKGRTDGVEFSVDVRQPGQVPQILFRKLLRPRTRPEDRGNHTERVVLSPFGPGSTLTLHTGPGPENDSGWDWAYYTKIRFRHGPFIAEQFPGFHILPVRIDAIYSGALDHEGGQVFMLNAPGTLEFALTGREHTLLFDGGLLPGAYTGEGHSDGAEFIVEYKRPDGSIEPVYRRLLNPLDRPADRGTQHFTVPLPAHASGTLMIVRTGVGPAGNGAWDWTYLSRLDIE